MAKPAPSVSQININLIPREELSGPLGRIILWFLGAGKIIILASEIIAILLFLFTIKLVSDNNNRGNTIGESIQGISSKTSIETNLRDAQTKLDDISQLKNPSLTLAPILDELESRLPSDVSLTELKLEGTTVTLTGNLHTAEGLQALISSLRDSKKIKDLEITQLTVPTSQSPVYSFTAIAKVGLTP